MIILSSEGLSINNETCDFTITQPSSTLTKNIIADEAFDLTKNPNAVIECELNKALIVTSTYPASFEYDGTVYSFNAKVTNQVYNAKGAYNVKLQVVGKVTAEDAPEIDPIYVRGWVNETNWDAFIEMTYDEDHNSYYIDLVPTEGAQNAGKFYITTSNDPETWQQHCLGDDGLSGVAIENYDTEYQLTEGRETYYIIYDPCRLTISSDTLIATFTRENS